MTDIDNIIAGINPDKYTTRKEEMQPVYMAKFKKALKENFSSAIESMKDFNLKANPAAEHKLSYNSSVQTLEPVYFWILDFMNGMFGNDVTKLVDNFASSPGSGHFAELNTKANQLQQQAMAVLGQVNGILKGVINVIYDLKEWQITLSHYDAANSKDNNVKEAGMLALKQRWMDKVDIQRGAGSINAMASGQLQFVTLRDAFMIVNSPEEVDKLDLNDRVKRVLKPRIQEFYEWKKRSEAELRKRFQIEKIYLKSQVDSLKLYSKWAKPYLKAAQQLTISDSLANKPDLVNIFNTVYLELTLMGKNSLKVEQAVVDKDLPQEFKKMKLRKYNAVVFVDFNFRGIPNRLPQGGHYVFGGKADVTFKAYALSDEELKLLKKRLEESDLNDSLKLVSGMTDDSLKQIQVDIDEFLNDKEKEKKQQEASDDINPFSALFGFLKSEKKEEKKEEKISDKIKSDSYAELYIRNFAEANAINSCYNIFDIYKKAHDMASLPYMADAEVTAPRTSAEELFGFNKPDESPNTWE